MEIAEERRDGALLLAPAGRLDSNSSGELEARLVAAIGAGSRRLVVDLARVDYVSSAGLRVLLMAAKKLKPVNGKILLSCLKPHIRDVFDIAGFTTIFPIHETDEQALRAFQNLPT